jgi:Na+-translocating ferredoxin:NAD+ oxidoreductase RnfD subunit
MSAISRILQFKYAPPIFISLILVIGHFNFGILESFEAILLAIGTSILTELLLSRLIVGEWKKNFSSAYITGISVSILIRSTFLWPFALAALISITSKYVLRFRGRHIWNPSNLGISWLLFFAPFSVAGLSIQWGNNIIPMLVIWTLGIVIVLKAQRLHVTVTYVASFLFFSFLRSLITGTPFLTEAAPLTGPMYQLFIFFMVTDPATTVRNKKGQMLVVFIVALVEFILRLNEFIYAPFFALCMVGPVAMIIDLELKHRKKRQVVPAPTGNQ